MATQVQDPSTNDPTGTPSEDDDLPDRGRPEADDNERAVEVRSKDGKTEVDVHQESRRERREREHREQRKREMEDFVAPLRQQNEELNRTLRELSGRLSQQSAPQAAPRQAEGDDEYLKLSEEMEGIISTIRAETSAQSMTPERGKSLKAKYYKLERQRAEIVSKATLAGYRPPTGPSQHEQMLANSHPDVWFNERARNHAANLAQAEQNRREVRERRGLTPSEIVEIQHASLKQAGEELGLTKPTLPTPSNGERARFAGTGATSRGTGAKVTRQLQDHEVEAATAMFPDEPENVAIEKWSRVAEKSGYFNQA